jgi:branched-chain amino acid transport system ATP-binding protein
MSETMLKVSEINVYYGSFHALWDVSLEVKEGEMVALIGPNGAGKTTTLNTIIGALKQQNGHIEFQNKSIDNLEVYERIAIGLAMVPEGRMLFPELTVLENLIIGSYIKRVERDRMLDMVFALFPILKERKNQLASTLSGGEQQMLAIGRALMCDPKLLIMDEVSLGLAPKVVDSIYKVVRELNTRGMTVLFVEQDVRRAIREAERVYVLEAGKVVLSSEAKEVSEENILRKYFGVVESENGIA